MEITDIDGYHWAKILTTEKRLPMSHQIGNCHMEVAKGSVRVKDLISWKAPSFLSLLPGLPTCGLVCQL